jgi:hypothetical protein
MEAIRHMATCTNNNRRLARFYRLIFGMEEVWNEEQNSPYAFYVTDGYFNLNCTKPFALTYKNEPPLVLKQDDSDGPYKSFHLLDPDGTYIALSEEGWEV